MFSLQTGVKISPQKNRDHRLMVSEFFVEIVGVEPTTPCLQSRCSSQLSYTPLKRMQIWHIFLNLQNFSAFFSDFLQKMLQLSS